MAYTQIKDIFQSESFRDYARERTVDLNALITTGAMITSPEFNALIKERSNIVELPFFKELSGDDEVITDGTALTVNGLESAKQVAVKLMRGKAFGMTDLAGAGAGVNKEKVIADRLAVYWNKKINNIITAELNGLFANNGALKDHLIDRSSEVIDGDMMIDLQGTMGDHYKELTFIIMHSSVYTKLRKLQLIDNIPDATNPAGSFEAFQGLRVIVDDACPVNNGVYDTYMFGKGAFAYGAGDPGNDNLPEYEIVREGLKSQTAVISRRTMIIAPVGFAYNGQNITSQTTPSNSALANASNWSRAYELKNIPMACLRTRIASEESES